MNVGGLDLVAFLLCFWPSVGLFRVIRLLKVVGCGGLLASISVRVSRLQMSCFQQERWLSLLCITVITKYSIYHPKYVAVRLNYRIG